MSTEIDWDDESVKTQVSERVEEAVRAAVEAVQAKAQEAEQGLRTKNRELLAEAKAAKEAAKVWEGLDADEVREALDKLEDMQRKGDGKSDDDDSRERAVQAAVERATRKHERELATVKEELATATQALEGAQREARQLLVDVALDEAMADNNVADWSRKAVRVMHQSEVMAQLDDEGEANREVAARVAGDILKKFAGTPEGKHFVVAPDTGGGGASGINGKGGAMPEEAKFFDPTHADFNLTRQGEVFNRDPKLYDQLAGKFASGEA